MRGKGQGISKESYTSIFLSHAYEEKMCISYLASHEEKEKRRRMEKRGEERRNAGKLGRDVADLSDGFFVHIFHMPCIILSAPCICYLYLYSALQSEVRPAPFRCTVHIAGM